jgi:hypothetical protein
MIGAIHPPGFAWMVNQDTKFPISDFMTFLLSTNQLCKGGGLLEHYYQGLSNHLVLEKNSPLPENFCHGS